jgi:hypothetical protein
MMNHYGRRHPYEDQYGGGNCTLCGSPNTNRTNCPLNPTAANPNHAKHPLARALMAQPAPVQPAPPRAQPAPVQPAPPRVQPPPPAPVQPPPPAQPASASAQPQVPKKKMAFKKSASASASAAPARKIDISAHPYYKHLTPFNPSLSHHENFMAWAQANPISRTPRSVEHAPSGDVQLDPNGYRRISIKEVPPGAIGVDLVPYLEEPDGREFIKLNTCHSGCSNGGVFDKAEIEELLKQGNTSCIYCRSPVSATVPTKPPFGRLRWMQDAKWVQLTIEMTQTEDAFTKRQYERVETAYIPVGGDHMQTQLGIWMYIRAFLNGSLFTMGRSATHGTYGIVFGTVHIKTKKLSIDGHGYGLAPYLEYIKHQGVLDHIIWECNASDIYTPEQMDSENTPPDHDKFIIRALATKLVDEGGFNGNGDDIHLNNILTDPDKRYSYSELTRFMLDLDLQWAHDQIIAGNVLDVVDRLTDILHRNDDIQYAITTKVEKAYDVIHGRTDPMSQDGLITPPMWNSYGYTQIVPIDPTYNFNAWGHNDLGGPTSVRQAATLRDISNYHVEGDPNAILMFHGTVISYRAQMENIDWTRGGGALGVGFYLTLNPAEALSYGCRKTGTQKYSVMLLECIVRNAHQLLNVRDFKRNTLDYFHNQVAGQAEFVNHVEVVRVHFFNPSHLKVADVALNNPNRISYYGPEGHYTNAPINCRTYVARGR